MGVNGHRANGGDNPHLHSKDVEAFEDEMRAGGVEWQLGICGDGLHSFTNLNPATSCEPATRCPAGTTGLLYGLDSML